ncbi:AraC family transcriptional regulator [Chromobacterium violaceum]|nr:AraC family transcriptional regulator [Chromobacterium violaceum]KMN88117.1 AraC family transcriptional regulator [Chromobacterium violaceum]KMN91341.1 AraC family transcriptional regulator [Chromobacterium violaceum]KMO04463.1 AraC family transcriptional regulator [Chromobacterium violaceum]
MRSPDVAEACVDRLDALLSRFPVHARMFHSGALCGVTDFSQSGEGGQLHLIRAGRLDVIHSGQSAGLEVNVPSLLFYPRRMPRRFVPDQRNGADLVCAELHFDGGAENPIVAALPGVVFLPLDSIAGAGAVLATLFDEAFSDNCGRHVVVDRLFEVVLVQLLRHLLEAGELRAGMLAGLAHSKLRKALAAMHEQPAREWSLARLAGIAGMSRSVFASNFRDIVGCTAGAYLQGWRIRLAQQALRQGKRLKMIAIEVGYGSEAALSRAFKAQCGVTPRAWRQSLAAD